VGKTGGGFRPLWAKMVYEKTKASGFWEAFYSLNVKFKTSHFGEGVDNYLISCEIAGLLNHFLNDNPMIFDAMFECIA
jgi:hypothetical protein